MSKVKQSNFSNEDINPCIEESNLSIKCLERELYDYSKCHKYFENYKNCKKFWGKISAERKKAGISPALPTKEERNKLMKMREEGITKISV